MTLEEGPANLKGLFSMSDSPSEIAELKSEVAALCTVVAALFASTMTLNSIGKSAHLAVYADAIARAGLVDPERVQTIVNQVAQQASVAAKVSRESRS